MGDGGSLFIGITLAALAIRAGKVGEASTAGTVLPFLILALPALDTLITLIRRLVKGLSLFTGDRGHLYDRIIERGWSPRATLLLFLAGGAVAGAAALALGREWFASCFVTTAIGVTLAALGLTDRREARKGDPREVNR